MSLLPKAALCANKRSASQRACDLAFIEDKSLNLGWTHEEIAAELARIRPYKISSRQVGYDMETLQNRWKANADQGVAEARAKMIRGLEKRQRLLATEYERSREDAKAQMAEEASGTVAGAKGGTKKRVTIQGRLGDVAYLRLMTDIDERLAKLRGLDAPEKVEHAGGGGGAIQTVIQITNSTPEEMAFLRPKARPANG